MSTEARKSASAAIFGWWSSRLADRERPAARALAARLRRASSPVAVLSEPAVHHLPRMVAARLEADEAKGGGWVLHALRDPYALVRVARVLAELREAGPLLARTLGEGAMSPLRFRGLLLADPEELGDVMRRAVVLADRRADPGGLALDLLDWADPERGEQVRIRWTFHYHGAVAPAALSDLSDQPRSDA